MSKLSFFSTVCLVALFGLASVAQAQRYECVVRSSSSIVPPSFLIEYSGGTATVVHGWIGGPHTDQVTVRGSDNRSRLNYSIRNVSGFGAVRANLAFRLMHNRTNDTLAVRIQPIGFGNSFSGSGSCQQQ